MKLSLNWIKDYVEIPENMDLKELAFNVTMSTVEVEGCTELARQFDNIIIGEIKEVNPHPNADKLRVCAVDIGGGDIKQIVCGGSNLEVGMSVVVACPGAIVRWHGEGEPVEIKNTKLRGVESYGMICASSEVGLFDLFPTNEEHEIMDLTLFGAKAGTPVAKALDLDDVILEIDNKSMTNRPDLWGHYGIAREISALYNLPLKEFKPFDMKSTGNFDVDVKDTDRCPRYIGVRMEGLSVKPSPFKMQSRIWRVGMRPINAIVDVTNYVMLASGQPTHMFDSDIISDNITVRRAENNEELLLLNGKQLKLSSDDLVIADNKGAVALAGVMGGAKDSVLSTTKNTILEVANFESTGVRRTALRYDNRTEASSRYEKAVDTERCDIALSMTMELLKELYPELKVTGFVDKYAKKTEKKELDVVIDWLFRRLGKRISNDEIKKKLNLLGFEVSFTKDTMHVIVPTWRSTGDVSIKADIMEEVARMYGYENFEPTSITTSFDGAINQLDIDIVRKAKEYLAFRCGMQEIFTYPWMEDNFVTSVLGSTDGILKLSTPPAPNQKYLRNSLLPNLCLAATKNERYYGEFSIFEEAIVFEDGGYTSKYDVREKLPIQKRELSGAFAGDEADFANLFAKSKGVLETMPRFTHMEAFTFKRETKPYWADETVWLNIYVGDEKIGNIGLLAKKISLEIGIKKTALVLFELETDKFKPFKSRTNKFTHLAEYPTIDYDINMLFDSNTKWEEIKTTVLQKKNAQSFLQDASFVDEYKGSQIPEGKKSVTIRLSIGSADRTLKSEEIESCASSVIKYLGKVYNANIRQ